MKKFITVTLLSMLLAPSIQGQIGFMGKRNYLNTDVLNTIYQGKYNLTYQFCVSNNITLKGTASVFNKKYPDVDFVNGVFFDDLLYIQYNIKTMDIAFRGFSYEIGMNLGYSMFTGMPMPVGYYMGISYEHISSTITEKCTVQKEYSAQTESKDFEFKSKAGIIKFQYGRNTYLKNNFILNTCVDLGLFIGNMYNPEYHEIAKAPEYTLPVSIPFWYRRKSFDSDYSGSSTYIELYIIPQIGIGYIF